MTTLCAYCHGHHRADEHGVIRRRLRWWEYFDTDEPLFRPREDELRPVTVELTTDDLERARRRAEKVIEMDESRGWRCYFAPPRGESKLDVNVRGFAAEIAASRVTGLELDPQYLRQSYRRSRKPADIGMRTEVRCARPKKYHDEELVSRRSDPPDRVLLLVIGRGARYSVVGWIEARDLQHPELWDEAWDSWRIDWADLNALPLPADA